MNAPPCDLRTLHSGTTILRNLIYHRAQILEPIRHLAFRNMRHLSDAMAYHPAPADAQVNSVEFKEWVHELQDRMLRDQGYESSEAHRSSIQIATFTPVKLYMALLYAEIEYLGKRAGEHPLSGNQDLGDFLRDDGDFIGHLKRFRDGMLHPNAGSIPSEKAWVSDGFRDELPRVQMMVDAIIGEARERLRSKVSSALLELPELQRWHCYRNFLEWLSTDDAVILDDVRYHQLVREIERQTDEYPEILRATGSTQPTEAQLETNKLLLQCMANLHYPWPFGGEVAEEGSLQPGMDRRFFKWVEFAVNPPATVKEWDRLARHVRDNLANYIFLLDAVGVLLNETMSQVSVEQTAGEPDDLDGRIRAAIKRFTFDQKQSIAGRSKVCLALFQGLVDAYETIRCQNPWMANQHVDAVITDGGAKKTIRVFRNIVFHVAEPSLDPYTIDDDASRLGPQSQHDLFLGFSKFIGSMKATVDSGNTSDDAAP